MSEDLAAWLRNLSDNWDDMLLDVEEDDHNGDDDEAFGDTGTARCLEAAMCIETLSAALAKAKAELVGLREQLARQAPVIEAARRWAAWGDEPALDEDWSDAEGNLYAAVRALSVPAPPEAPCAECGGTLKVERAVKRIVGRMYAADVMIKVACPTCQRPPSILRAAPPEATEAHTHPIDPGVRYASCPACQVSR